MRSCACLCIHPVCAFVHLHMFRGLEERLDVCLRGFDEALLAQHISPGTGDSGARLSVYA